MRRYSSRRRFGRTSTGRGCSRRCWNSRSASAVMAGSAKVSLLTKSRRALRGIDQVTRQGRGGLAWLVPIWVVYAWGQRSSQGLLVSLPRKGFSKVAIAWGLTAPLVKIDAKGRPYLNYKQTTWEELPWGLEQ